MIANGWHGWVRQSQRHRIQPLGQRSDAACIVAVQKSSLSIIETVRMRAGWSEQVLCAGETGSACQLFDNLVRGHKNDGHDNARTGESFCDDHRVRGRAAGLAGPVASGGSVLSAASPSPLGILAPIVKRFSFRAPASVSNTPSRLQRVSWGGGPGNRDRGRFLVSRLRPPTGGRYRGSPLGFRGGGLQFLAPGQQVGQHRTARDRLARSRLGRAAGMPA